MEWWIAIAIGCYFIWSVLAIGDGYFMKRHFTSAVPYVLTHGLTGLGILFVLPFITLEQIFSMDPKWIFLSLLVGFAFLAWMVCYLKAAQREDMSRVIVLTETSPLFILLGAVFILKESLNTFEIVAVGLFLVGGVLASIKRNFKLVKGIVLVYIAAHLALYSVDVLLAKAVYNVHDFVVGFFWLKMGSLLATLVFFVLNRTEVLKTYKKLQTKTKSFLAVKTGVDVITLAVFHLAFAAGPVSIIAALSSTMPVFVFVLSLVASVYFPTIAQEELDPWSLLRKIGAVACVSVGIVLISI